MVSGELVQEKLITTITLGFSEAGMGTFQPQNKEDN